MQNSAEQLSLYYTPWCPYCIMVLRAAEELGVSMTLNDISVNQEHFDSLLAARQRATVPVLRIQTSDGTDEWLPESRDIVHYLEQLKQG